LIFGIVIFTLVAIFEPVKNALFGGG